MNSLDQGICPATGISKAYSGDEKGKLFAFRETSKADGGIMTITSMAVFETPVFMPTADARKERIQKVFEAYPKDVHHILDRVQSSSIYENAVYDIQVLDEWSKGPVVLIGDSSHACTPGMGQGANLGLEDACELAYSLSQLILKPESNGNDLEPASTIPELLDNFWKSRMERVKLIHQTSSERTMQVNQSNQKTRIYGRD
mmetsp:Transcript_20546/g.56720  ORF Transcript_20546/g.56720 Transcript_20546/m.56720 type:complete len:201 (+) Transcript_20546:631-1233(+)